MKILVTGGAGFIGSHIVDLLIDNGLDVVIIDNLSTGKKEFINSKAKFYKADIGSKEISEIFEKERPDYVMHNAAQVQVQKSISNPIFDSAVNILGTINLLECCKNFGVKKVIYSSSAAVYGNPEYLGIDEKHPLNPISGYGVSKHTCEHYLYVYNKLYGLEYTVLRYANVYGARQDAVGEGGVIPTFVNKLMNNERPVIYGDGEQTRDFIYVKDIASANYNAMSGGTNEIINISTNNASTINIVFYVMAKLMNKRINPIYKEKRKGDIMQSYLNNSKAKALLNWEPLYSLKMGLDETICYYK